MKLTTPIEALIHRTSDADYTRIVVYRDGSGSVEVANFDDEEELVEFNNWNELNALLVEAVSDHNPQLK